MNSLHFQIVLSSFAFSFKSRHFTEALQAAGKKSTGLKRHITIWCKGVGAQIHRASQFGSKTSHPYLGGAVQVAAT
jgi:hypothetical protein